MELDIRPDSNLEVDAEQLRHHPAIDLDVHRELDRCRPSDRPLEAVVAVAWQAGLWLYIDGAYGGLAAIAIPKQLTSLSFDDSLSLDLHKWHVDVARATFSQTGDYVSPTSNCSHRSSSAPSAFAGTARQSGIWTAATWRSSSGCLRGAA